MIYGTRPGPMCGGSGGSRQIITLKSGEYITTAEGLHGFTGHLKRYGYASLTQLKFMTNLGTRYGPYGRGYQGETFRFNAPDSMGLAAINSNDASYVRDITFHFKGKNHFVSCHSPLKLHV